MISKFEVDLTSDIAGLIGGLALVRPAWRVLGLAKQRLILDQINLGDKDHEVIHKIREAARRQIEIKITQWDRLDELAILAGVLLVTVSFGIKIAWAFIIGPSG